MDFRGKRGDEQIEPQNADLIIFEQTKKIVATNYKIKLISFKVKKLSMDRLTARVFFVTTLNK